MAATRALALDLEALLLPKACLGCERPLPKEDEPRACCAVCLHRLRRVAPPVCGRCGQPLDRWSARWGAGSPAGTGRAPEEASPCEFCAEWPGELAWAGSAVWLEDGPARNLVHALKYGGWTIAARPMALVTLRAMRDRLAGVDALVPVPLGRTRARERGHNQAEVLARELGALCELPVLPDALRRVRETRTQTRLPPHERRRNVAGAFAPAGRRLGGMQVALVDDVVTTGATVAAAAVALAALRPARIGAISFARAPVPA